MLNRHRADRRKAWRGASCPRGSSTKRGSVCAKGYQIGKSRTWSGHLEGGPERGPGRPTSSWRPGFPTRTESPHGGRQRRAGPKIGRFDSQGQSWRRRRRKGRVYPKCGVGTEGPLHREGRDGPGTTTSKGSQSKRPRSPRSRSSPEAAWPLRPGVRCNARRGGYQFEWPRSGGLRANWRVFRPPKRPQGQHGGGGIS